MRWSRESYRSGQHALTDEELQLVLRHAPSYSDEVLFRLAVATGLRREDIVRLRWSDVDFENRRVSWYEQKKRRNRSVYVSPDVVESLRKLRSSSENDHYLFTGSSDRKYGKGHLTGKTAYNRYHAALRAAGLKERPFHSLRATCIKLCQKRGWTITQAAEHVGDTVRVIEQHYLAPSDGEMRSATSERPII